MLGVKIHFSYPPAMNIELFTIRIGLMFEPIQWEEWDKEQLNK